MRTLLFLTCTLFLVACSDNTSSEQSPASASAPEKAASVQQSEPAVVAVQTEEVTVQPEAKPAAEPAVVQEDTAVNGHRIFARQCASCHGQNGEKSALNKSNIIQGWAVEKTVMALKGYQDGSYGSSMKGIMKAQVNGFTPEQIDAVAEYIATL